MTSTKIKKHLAKLETEALDKFREEQTETKVKIYIATMDVIGKIKKAIEAGEYDYKAGDHDV